MVGQATAHIYPPGGPRLKHNFIRKLPFSLSLSLSLLQKAKVSSSKLHAIEVINHQSYSCTHTQTCSVTNKLASLTKTAI